MTSNVMPTDETVTDTMPTDTMPVEVWSDVVCPWCCIGRAHLKQALGEFEHADAVEVTWRSFELDPTAPAQATEPLAEQLGRKYGGTPADIQAMFAGVTARAAAVGLDFRFDSAQPGNTVDAHRLLHLARESGRQDQLKERFFTAYFTEGEAIGDPDTLARLAKQAGLDPTEVDDVLATDRYLDAVRADEAEARELQVSGVPFFVIDRRYAVAGAQPTEVLVGALRRAWAEREAT
jgi:predicted DsbA family dithiol-disulfide isomerase